MIQATLVSILEDFGNLPYQAEPRVKIKRLSPLTQEQIEPLRLGIVFKEQRRTTFMHVEIDCPQNPGMVDPFQQPEFSFGRLPLRLTAEFRCLPRLGIETHTACSWVRPCVACQS